MEPIRHDPGFPPTRWSVVERLRTGEADEARDALEQLCSTYWEPVQRTIQRRGFDHDAASDLTQAFFLRLLGRGDLERVDASRGRLRAYLRASARYFVANHREREAAACREGDVAHLALEDLDPRTGRERGGALASVDHDSGPSEWLEQLVQEALAELGRRAKRRGLEAFFDHVKPTLVGDAAPSTAVELAEVLGTTEGAIRAQVFRMRASFRRVLRERIVASLGADALGTARLEELAALWSDTDV